MNDHPARTMMKRTLNALALLTLLFVGCASSKQTVNYGPVPPLRDVMNHFEYLQQRLQLSDVQSDKVYDILEDHVTALEKTRLQRQAGQQLAQPPSGPPSGGMSGGRGGLTRGKRQQNSQISRLDEILVDRMKAVLDKPQFKEYKRIRKEMEKQREQDRPRGGPPGGRGGFGGGRRG
ncbi:hypothetical protein KQI63_12990 [bacterium]|nr:hypothetical protein [bacterium]